MPNDGDRKKSRKKNSSKRIADAVEQARQASQSAPPESQPIAEVRETAPTMAEEVETAHADAMPLLENEPQPAGQNLETLAHESGATTLAERASCILGDVQRLAAEYIDASEDFAHRILEIQCAAASWAEGTPLERVLKAQNSFGQRIVESSARAARALWRVDRAAEARG